MLVESRLEVLEFLKSEACVEMLVKNHAKLNTFRLDTNYES